jgi:hypothetical protein
VGGVVDAKLPEIVQAGIDTVSLYLCLEGSPALGKVSRLPGKPVAYGGTMLGEHASWGSWAHTFGFRAIWRPERKRLSLFPRLAGANELCPIDEFESRVQVVIGRLAAVGVVSYLPLYVTRFDVAVDGRFDCQRTARNFLHALHGCRVPNGGRTDAVSDPIGTVYLRPRTGKDITGRAYDKGREMRERARRGEREGLPEPYSLVRVESVHRFDPESLRVEMVPSVAREAWRGRFMRLIPDGGAASVVIPFDLVRGRIVQSVKDGLFKPSQAERLRLFLELEATGEAESFYGPKQFAARRREARRFGLRVEDAGRTALDFDLERVLTVYDESAAWGVEAPDPCVQVAGGAGGPSGMAAERPPAGAPPA